MTAGTRPGRSATPRPNPVPRRLVDPLLLELGTWLDTGVASDPAVARPEALPSLRRLVVAHGLASVLVRDEIAGRILASLPAELGAWLVDQDERNGTRIRRLLEELAAALRAFAVAGVGVMPLKGAILATRMGADPSRRPMADLDLLVRPADRSGAAAVLVGLGYRRRDDRTRRPTHDTYELPGNDVVVATDGEHPDNPRRVELHTEVKRHLWGWVDDDDLTPFLWAGATEGRILGEPAILPSTAGLVAHLAVHGTSDLLLRRGRLVQWLDLAEVLGSGGDAAAATIQADAAPHPSLRYPALRLAARCLPSRFAPGGDPGLAALEARIPRRLARWVATVPLDSRSGLQSGRLLPGDAATLAGRWARWAPEPWRLAVAYGEVPLGVALVRHARRLAGAALSRPG